MTEKATQAKRKEARPSKGETRAEERPRTYAPIGDFRGALTVAGKDGEWMYRWFNEKSHQGQRILNAQLAGWDLVDYTKEENLQVGEQHVEYSTQYGSLIRKPSDKEGTWLYLMRMPQWAYDQVQKTKQEKVDSIEDDMFREYSEDGGDELYGKNRIGHGLRPRRSVEDSS